MKKNKKNYIHSLPENLVLKLNEINNYVISSKEFFECIDAMLDLCNSNEDYKLEFYNKFCILYESYRYELFLDINN